MAIKQLGTIGSSGIYKLYLSGVDVTKHVAAISFYADILSPGWTCNINFASSYTVDVKKYSTVRLLLKYDAVANLNANTLDFNFIVYNIAASAPTDAIFNSKYISCIAEHVFNDLQYRTAKYFNGKVSDIAKELITSIGKVPDVSSSDNNTSFTAPNITALQTLYSICRYAHKNNNADYLLFQRNKSTLAFKSFNDIYNEIPKHQYYFTDGNVNVSAEVEVNKLLGYKVNYDSGSELQKGYDAATHYAVDVIGKSVTKSTLSQQDTNSKNSYTSLTDKVINPAAAVTVVANNSTLYSTPTINANTASWNSSRRVSLLDMDRYRLTATLHAHTAHLDNLGSVINLNLIKQTAADKYTLSTNKELSGKYIVSAVNINILSGYLSNDCTIELIKLRSGNL